MKYKIFGLNVEIQCESEYKAAVESQMDLYPKSTSASELTVYISRGVSERNQYRGLNEESKPFAVEFPSGRAVFSTSGAPAVKMEIKNEIGKRLEKRRFRSPDFELLNDKLGQIIHEDVLIPAVFIYFSDRLAPVHSTSLHDNRDGRAVMISGTGGCGKTTTENLLLLRDQRYEFLSDDISLIDKNGVLHANYNYPKIYGYNALKNHALDILVQKQISGVNKYLWNRRKSSAPSYVRRRISPMNYHSDKLPPFSRLKKIFHLIREEREQVRISELGREEFCTAASRIMLSEYNNALFNKVHIYDSGVIAGGAGRSMYTDIMNNYSNTLITALRDIRSVTVISIPMNFDEKEIVNIIDRNE